MADTTQPQIGTQPAPSPGPAQQPEPRRAEEPEFRKPDLQILLQDFAQANQTIFRERREAERRLAEERERSRWEQERIRLEMGERLKDSERQNDVLIRTLGRLQGENDRLREDLAVARASKPNGHALASPVPSPEPPPGPLPVPVLPRKDVSPMPGTAKVAVLAVPTPQLSGRPLPVAESPTAPPPQA